MKDAPHHQLLGKCKLKAQLLGKCKSKAQLDITSLPWEWNEVLVTQSVWLFVTPWTITHQTPLSMVFSRQEYWRGLPFPSAGDLPDPGIEPRYPALQADSLPSEPPGNPWLTYQLSYQILFFLWWPIRIISKIFILGDFLNWGIIDIQHYISFSYTT